MMPIPEPLYPIYEEGKHRGYVEALKAVLKDEKSANIALSGPYGSGKSSILEGLLDDHDTGRLHPRSVSLATMGSRRAPESPPGALVEVAGDGDSGRHLNAINLVQKEVCKQLLFSAPAKKFPMSRYFRPYQPGRWERLGWGGIAVLPALLIAAVVVAALDLSKWWGIAVYVLLGVLAVIATYLVWPRLAGRVLVSEVGAAGAKITLHREKTYFDEHLTELMYFFEVTECRLVIFEDLDRFNSLPLVETLRDLNLTLNSGPHDARDTIHFIYALGDELFEAGEARSKMFDTIVPIVPFASQSTSRGLLAGKLKNDRPLSGDIDVGAFDQVERIISNHVHDHRLLTTIFNEFLIYRDKATPTRALDMLDSQLLAAVAYKCILPSDYAKSYRLDSYMDKINAAAASDRRMAEDRCIAVRRRLTSRERLLTPYRIRRANGLLGALGDPAERNVEWWNSALESGARLVWTRVGPEQIAQFLAEGEPAQIMPGELDERDEALRDLDILEMKVRSASIGELVDVIIPSVDSSIERYLVDIAALDGTWRSPDALAGAPGLVESLARAGALDGTFSAYVALANEGHLTIHAQSFVRTVIEGYLPDPSHELNSEDAVAILRDYSEDLMADERGLHVSIADAVFSGGEPSTWDSYAGLLNRVPAEALRRFVEDYLQRGQKVESLLDTLAPTPWAALASLAARPEDARWLDRALQHGVNLDSKFPVRDESELPSLSSDVDVTHLAMVRKAEIKESIAVRAHRLPSLTQLGDSVDSMAAVVESLSALQVVVCSDDFTPAATRRLAAAGILAVTSLSLDRMAECLEWDGTLTSEALPQAMVQPVVDGLAIYLAWAHRRAMSSVADGPRFSATDGPGAEAVDPITRLVSQVEGLDIAWGHLREVADIFEIHIIDVATPATADPSNLANALLLDLVPTTAEIVECIASDRRATERWAQGVQTVDEVRATVGAGGPHARRLASAVVRDGKDDVACAVLEDSGLRGALPRSGAEAALRRFLESNRLDPVVYLELAITAKRLDAIKAVISESAGSVPSESLRQALIELGEHFKDSLDKSVHWPAADSAIAKALNERDGVRITQRRSGDKGYNVDATGLVS